MDTHVFFTNNPMKLDDYIFVHFIKDNVILQNYIFQVATLLWKKYVQV